MLYPLSYGRWCSKSSVVQAFPSFECRSKGRKSASGAVLRLCKRTICVGFVPKIDPPGVCVVFGLILGAGLGWFVRGLRWMVGWRGID